MSENKPNWIYDFFSITIILMLMGAGASLFALGSSTILTPETVLSQSVTVVLTYLLLIGLVFTITKLIHWIRSR